ncbi:hypothetical protein F0L74_12620 [Chitinophaga agrisoli]|uniref:Uncharacterized protein n=1 Tax=Chitinophaga agrisoli TaxID=2607653 RepID=A0A5B2VYD4_9BACT|nr:hypothetical protein [Chitinophaga agrisoli]KAA2243342.1 hypothetical protein F0L74_12620 [Chitinophaga agrisoli]
MTPVYLCSRLAGWFFLVTTFSCENKDSLLHSAPPVKANTLSTVIAYNGEATVPLSWYQLELKLIKESKEHNFLMTARTIAYTGIALREAAGAGAFGIRRLGGPQVFPTPEKGKKYIAAIAANSAMANIMRGIFQHAGMENQHLITQLENDNLQLLAGNYSQEEILRSVNFGRLVAIAVYQWSKTDGS